MCAGISLTIITYLKYPDTIFSAFGYFTIGVAIFLLYTHRENIQRMLSGDENQFKKVMIFNKFFKNL
jgi:glycerol-3-phosphate acyltransferase PlsY